MAMRPRSFRRWQADFVVNKAPVRLRVVETKGPAESAAAFSSGKTDLAVVRGDVGDLSQAQAIVVLTEAVALLVAPPGPRSPMSPA